MEYAKMLGLLAVAAVALMAVTNSAVAGVVTSPPGTVYTGEFKAHAETAAGGADGYATLHNAVGTISCRLTITGRVEQHGAAVTAGGQISSLTFTECTNGAVHPRIVGGELEFHPTGSGNATVTWTGGNFTTTMFGFECGYTTSNTHLGAVTGGAHATLHINASLPRTHGSFFCGSALGWTGAIKFLSPTNIAFS